MSRSFFGAALLCSALATLIGGSALAAQPQRARLSLDAGWRFHLGDFSETHTGASITTWRWKADPQGTADWSLQSAPALDPRADGWQDASPGQDTFGGKPGYNWYVTDLNDIPVPGRSVHFESVDDDGVVFLNGKRLTAHRGWNDPFDVPLDSAWNARGPNRLVVLVQNETGPGSIGAAYSETLTTAGPAAVRPGYDDSGWRIVQVPHDFVVEGSFDQTADASHGFLPKNVGWYRKAFTVPSADSGRRLWLDFDGVYRNSTVWLNGKYLGNHASGYIGFRYDITNDVRYGGVNTIAVRVDARGSEGWWYEGGGIYRHVWLTAVAPVHVAPWGVYVVSNVHGLDATGQTRPAAGIEPPATVTVTTTLENSTSHSESVSIQSQVYGPDGSLVNDGRTRADVPAGGRTDVSSDIPVPAAHLWSPETPSLYRMRTTLKVGGIVTDSVDTPFGIRTEYFDVHRGFFLNGMPVKLKGACNHQDFAGVGIALPDTLFKYRIERMKWIDCNSFRTSHNPVAPELLDECDRQGMLVMDENRHLGDTYSAKSGPGTTADDLSDLKDQILRDRNHPCVIMWSLCNEEFQIEGTDEGARVFSAMMKAVHALDKTRPISCAMDSGFGKGISNVEDLQGINYHPYMYDGYHLSHPNIPMFGSETASAVEDRGVYKTDAAAGWVNAYDTTPEGGWATTAEAGWQPIDARDFMAGGFVWTAFDYRGEPAPFSWPCVNSCSGILDMCGFPKDAAYYYKAWWGDKPIVHILPHWNWQGHEGEPIDVWCYSNAQSVELFLNGKSLGVQTMPRAEHVNWSVPYEPGTLEAKASTNGVVVADDKVVTTGPPAAIRLSTDFQSLRPNGEDTAPVAVSIVDAAGRVVPTAANLVSFQVTGAGHINGVGNGNPSDHESDRGSQRYAFNGLCMVLPQSGVTPGTITVTAQSPGLAPASLAITVK